MKYVNALCTRILWLVNSIHPALTNLFQDAMKSYKRIGSRMVIYPIVSVEKKENDILKQSHTASKIEIIS